MKNELQNLLESLNQLVRYSFEYNEKHESIEEFDSDCGEYVKYDDVRPIIEMVESLLQKHP